MTSWGMLGLGQYPKTGVFAGCGRGICRTRIWRPLRHAHKVLFIMMLQVFYRDGLPRLGFDWKATPLGKRICGRRA
jgi:hypothetical protein